MAEAKKTIVYTMTLSGKEMETIIKALEQCSDSEVPGSYNLWMELREKR